MRAKPGGFYIRKLMDQLNENPDGVDSDVLESLGLTERFMTLFDEELKYIEIQLKLRTKHVDAVERLQTIPGIVNTGDEPDGCQAQDASERVMEWIEMFPGHATGNVCDSNYEGFLTSSIEAIEDSCADFLPGSSGA